MDIRYSPTEDRVMFPVINPESKEIAGYTGRAKKNVRPKWKKYGDCSSLFTCGTGKIAVVVEDCLSACAVGVVKSYTGTALLGTILTQTHISELRKFDSVLVCLDPDATLKGLQMVNRLSGTVPASLRILPNDLKYYDKYKIMEILNDD